MIHFLQKVISLKQKEIETLKVQRPITEFIDSKCLHKVVRSFKEALRTPGGINLIAEIKRKSPSRKKVFFKQMNVSHIALLYAKSGAKAISVLTDKKYFGGDISYINDVRRTVNLPVLRKDFIIDEYQIYESRYFGADAILLIARILTRAKIKSFIYLAKKIGMDVLVEIHDERDLEKALLAGAEIIGINNRDLDTFTVNLDVTFKLASRIPDNIIKVSESGIKSSVDIMHLKKAKINAVLIGASFLEAKDISKKVRQILYE